MRNEWMWLFGVLVGPFWIYIYAVGKNSYLFSETYLMC